MVEKRKDGEIKEIKCYRAALDQNKINCLVRSFKRFGWYGLPVVTIDCGDHLEAVNGAHRIAAAGLADIDVLTYTIRCPKYYDDEEKQEELRKKYITLSRGSFEEKYEAMRELDELFLIDRLAVEIMSAEEY